MHFYINAKNPLQTNYFRAESNRWKQHRRYMKTEAAKRTITFEDDWRGLRNFKSFEDRFCYALHGISNFFWIHTFSVMEYFFILLA